MNFEDKIVPDDPRAQVMAAKTAADYFTAFNAYMKSVVGPDTGQAVIGADKIAQRNLADWLASDAVSAEVAQGNFERVAELCREKVAGMQVNTPAMKSDSPLGKIVNLHELFAGGLEIRLHKKD